MHPARLDLRRLDRVLLVCCWAVLGLTVLYPTLRLVTAAIAEWQTGAIASARGLEALRNSALLAFGSVAGAGAVGSLFAAVVSRFEFPGRTALAAMGFLPFTLPPLVGVLAFYYIIGRDGFVPRALENLLGWEDAQLPGPAAILLVHVYSFFVFFYAMVGAALEGLDRAQFEAARSLGAGPMRAFLRVTLPQLSPALMGASLLAFMSSNASFSAPYFFGQDFPVLPVEVFYARSQNEDARALTLTVVLAALSLAGILLFGRRRRPGGSVGKGVRVPLRSAATRWAAGAGAWLTILLLLLPHITIVWFAFVDYRAWHTEIIPTVFTMENFARLLREPGVLAPIRNSVWTSALATAATVAIGLPAAYLYARHRPGGRALNLLVMVPWALPGTVIAMNLIVAFNDPWLPLYNTVWLLPLAYFVRAVPILARMAAAAIEPFDASLVEAAQTLGASPRRVFLRIVGPLLLPSLTAATALVFATSLGEFVASILLYVPANMPISVRINMEWRSNVGIAFAYSVLLMGLVAVTFYLARRVAARSV